MVRAPKGQAGRPAGQAAGQPVGVGAIAPELEHVAAPRAAGMGGMGVHRGAVDTHSGVKRHAQWCGELSPLSAHGSNAKPHHEWGWGQLHPSSSLADDIELFTPGNKCTHMHICCTL